MAGAGTYNIVGAFKDASRAKRAVNALSQKGLTRRNVNVVEQRDRTDPARVGAMKAEMQQEVSEAFAGPSVGFFTLDQAKGASFGTVAGSAVGLAIGLIVGLGWAFLMDSAMSTVGRIAIPAICLMVAGGAVGFIAGGALKPRMEGKERSGAMLDERRLTGVDATLVTVEVSGEDEAAVAQEVLEGSGATRVDAIDREGSPLPPQSEHPRPADPPGYWSEDSKRG